MLQMNKTMEELYAEVLLWLHGFTSNEDYEALLNESFLNDTKNELLFELEECSSDLKSTYGRFHRYWNYECPEFDSASFGKRLFEGLEKVYISNRFSSEAFGKQCNRLWGSLPSELCTNEPFHTLIYADECLEWQNGEVQTRELYEKAFSFYK